MSRFAWLVAVCGLALTAGQVLTADPLTDKQKATNIQNSLRAKIDFDGTEVRDLTLSEVLQKLGKAHGIEFVVREDEFTAAGVANIKDRKSHFSALDTKGLTVPQFLDVWLASVGATYKLEPTRLAIVPAPRWNDKVGGFNRTDRAAITLTVLDTEFRFWEGANYNEIPLFEIVSALSKTHNQTFTINEEAFKHVGIANIKEEKPNLVATQLREMSMRQFLNLTLNSMGATYLVKNGVIEIVPIQYAAKVTKSGVSQDDDNRARLNEPLVSAILKEKPLNEAVAKIAEMYDLTVIVSPQAGDAKTGFVTARLLNLPADKALELLALQCDLRVVRRGAAFLITSKDHANELFNEKLDRERQKIEVQKLREAPAKPPAPPEVPPAPPAPKM